jgi:hypothetical protein
MKQAGHPDYFVVINGPEDGAEFPIARTPNYIGSDPHCAVNLRLDSDIEPYHARVTVVSDGYRIRGIGGAPVFADGKRVGSLFSYILRDGEFVQAGNTLLALECAPDGLASRSRGMASESDIGWMLRQSGDFATRASRRTARFSANAFREATHHWKFLFLLGIVVAYLIYAPFRSGVNRLVAMAWAFIQSMAG